MIAISVPAFDQKTVRGALRSVALLVAADAFCLIGTQASITHKPHFKVEGVVIVWGGTSGSVSTQMPDAQAGQSVEFTAQLPVITGNLTPVSANRDGAARPLIETSNHFFVASNTAFSVDAELTNSATLRAVTFEDINLTIKTYLSDADHPTLGTRAQYPHSAGSSGGVAPGVQTLADIRTRTTIFRGNQRTAAEPGTIKEQSIKFEMTYEMSKIERPGNIIAAHSVVTYTVFVP